MSIELKVGGIDEVPEVMRPYVSEKDGVIVYDDEAAMKGLRAERDTTKTLKSDKAKVEAELLKYTALGKSPEELAAAISANDGAKLTEAEKKNLEQSNIIKDLQSKVGALMNEKAEAERIAKDMQLRKAVESIIDQLPQDQDREKHRAYWLGGKTADGVEFGGAYKSTFKLGESGAVENVGDKSASDYIAAVGKSFNFTKASNPGIASAGNATIGNGSGSAAYLAAKKSGDVGGMIASAPVLD